MRSSPISEYTTVIVYFLGTWMFSSLLAMPPLVGWGRYAYLPGQFICFCEWPSSVSYTIFMVAVCFGGLCSIMSFSYFKILEAVRESKRKQRDNTMWQSNNLPKVAPVSKQSNNCPKVAPVTSSVKRKIVSFISKLTHQPAVVKVSPHDLVNVASSVPRGPCATCGMCTPCAQCAPSVPCAPCATCAPCVMCVPCAPYAPCAPCVSCAKVTCVSSDTLEIHNDTVQTVKAVIGPPPHNPSLQHSPPHNPSPHDPPPPRNSSKEKEEQRLTQSFLVVVSVFIACWSPFCVTMFWSIISPTPVPRVPDMFTLLLGCANSCCNPIIYGVMNRKYRDAFKYIFFKRCPFCC